MSSTQNEYAQNYGLKDRISSLHIRQFKLSLLLVFLIFTGCASISNLFEKPQEGEEPSAVLIQQERDTLLTETIALLNINREQSPDQFRLQQQRFEQALQDYLETKGAQNEQVVTLQNEQRLIVIPVQSLYQDGTLTAAQLSGDPLEMQRTLSPVLNGEVLDFAQLSGSGNENLTLAVLFPDSLIVLTRTGVDSFQTDTYQFPREVVSIIKSRIQTGLMGRIPGIGSPGVVALTTALTDPVVFSMDTLWSLQQDTSSRGDRIENPANWISVVGQGLFRNPSHNVRAFLGLRDIANSPHYILLDNAGYLHLLTDSSDQLIWSSNQPAGKRLFTLPENHIGVTNDTSHSFNLFRYSGDSLSHLGVSQEFADPISALSNVEIGNTRGIGISFRTMDDEANPGSRIEFLPLEYLEWDSTKQYPHPSFPNYLANFKVFEQHTQEPDTLVPGSHLALSYNLFETLVSPPGSDKPALVSLSASDNNRVWTVRFRRNLRLPNGSLLTSEQIIQGWLNTFRIYGLNASNSWLWKDIAGIEAFMNGETEPPEGLQSINNTTIRVIFENPRPLFPEHLSHPVFRVYARLPDYNYPVGFGPYYITDMQIEDGQSIITANRNRYYYTSMPPLEQITLQDQQLNITDSLSVENNSGGIVFRKKDVSYFQQIPNYTVREFPVGELYFLALNPDTLISSQSVRTTILNALDREVTANIIDASFCAPQTDFFGLQAQQNSADVDSLAIDSLESLSIVFPANNMVAQQIAERLAARLTQIGIPHEVPQSVAIDNFSQLRSSGDYDILVDHFTPSFRGNIYNAMELLNRGYQLPSGFPADWEETLLQNTSDNSPVIQQLAQAGIFSPVLASRSFGILPVELRDVQLYKSNVLDLSTSWFPRRR